MSAYFPGPWWVSGRQIKGLDHDRVYTLATVQNSKMSEEGEKATRRLMAVAPELLDELQAIHSLLKAGCQIDPEFDGERIRILITKATGEDA